MRLPRHWQRWGNARSVLEREDVDPNPFSRGRVRFRFSNHLRKFFAPRLQRKFPRRISPMATAAVFDVEPTGVC